MNSLDAIIALAALMAGCGTLLGAITSERDAAADAMDSLEAKTGALACASIIDSIYSNSAEGYEKEFSCGAGDRNVSMAVRRKTKTVPIITSAKKALSLEVETLAHYLE